MEKEICSIAPLSISQDARLTIRDFLRKKFMGDGDGCYFFRRFAKLNNASTKPISITRHFGQNVYETLDSLKDLDENTIKKSIEIRYNWFSGFTEARSIRNEHPYLHNKEIYIHSNDYGQIDLSLNYTFKFSNVKQLNSHITPQSSDLLFIYIRNECLEALSTGNNKVASENILPKLKPRATMWCIVSEQFLRAWTLINYDWHDSFDKYIPINTLTESREGVLREKLFIGNKLMTNSWLKHKLSLEQHNQIMMADESREKYFHLRTEYVSRKWVDVYAALVLISRYGELPCPANVPNNSSNNSNDCLHARLLWSLPNVFVTMLLHCSIGSTITEHLVNYNVWKAYSNASMMFSMHGQKQRGFFDDIHQIKMAGAKILTENNARDITDYFKEPTFTEIGEEKDEENDSIDTWAKIVKFGTRPAPLTSVVNATENLPSKDITPCDIITEEFENHDKIEFTSSEINCCDCHIPFNEIDSGAQNLQIKQILKRPTGSDSIVTKVQETKPVKEHI